MIWKEEAQHINRSADEDEQLRERPARKCTTAAADAATFEARIRESPMQRIRIRDKHNKETARHKSLRARKSK
jgi:hypothetical protein